MSEYGELETNEETQTFDIENGTDKKTIPQKRTCPKIQIPKPCLFIIFLLILGYYLYISTSIFYTSSPDSNVDDFNFTEDIIYSPPSANDLTARAFPHSRFHHKTCDDFEYGCCKVYSQCKIKNGYLDYREHTLTHYKIIPKDRIQSNCYSLDHLVHMWNVEYKSENESETCENSQYGCCPTINTACDFAIRNKRENNQDTIDFYKQHLRHSHRITVPKKDKQGSNCPGFRRPSVFDIVYAYNNGYPDSMDDLHFFMGLLCFLAFLFCLSHKT